MQLAASKPIPSDGHVEAAGLEKDRDTTGEGSKEEDNEDCWSDDDLFQDNSFLIEATQNPEKFINTSFDMSTKGSCISSSQSENLKSGPSAESRAQNVNQSPDSSFIPPSCAPRKVSALNKFTIPLSSSTSHIQAKPQISKNSTGAVKTVPSNKGTTIVTGRFPPHQNVSGRNPKLTSLSSDHKTFKGSSCQSNKAYNAKFTSSVNKFAGQSLPKSSSCNVSNNTVLTSQSQSLNSSTTIAKLPAGSQVKTSFRKFHSFQAELANKAGNPARTNGSLCSPQSNSFKRTLSFDSSCSAMSTSSNITTPVINSGPSNNNGSKPPMQSISSRNDKLFAVKSSSCANTNKGHAQTGAVPGATKQRATVPQPAAEDGFDLSLTEDVLQQLLEVDEVFDSQADILATGQPPVAAAAGNTTSSCVPSKTSPTSNGVINTAPSVTSLRVSSLRSNTPVRPFKQRRSLAQPSSSTPVKLARACPAGGKEDAATTSDSGTELFDSFLNEDVYESQILPFLEKIESESTTCPPDASGAPKNLAVPSNSPVKCSPEEIEQKRQAALQRRSLRLSQTNRKSSWR
ncbi:hypothetical protein ElyMa_001663000 [Elysia marginata]|uniref:Uncharacterized protein n=1 Tax=Elysia marginata TaxID=1093978 RepID=A0AAV4JPU3_9GAST|nr:hypothetical protein ElyMa_001663000 [Elysia marginata]